MDEDFIEEAASAVINEVSTVDPDATSLATNFDGREDPTIFAGTKLVGYDEISDAQVFKTLKDFFRGFHFDINEDFSSRFESVDSIADYTVGTINDIAGLKKASDARKILCDAAALARFWCLGTVISSAMRSGKLGKGANEKLAFKLGKSSAYIYQYRAVAERMSISECYLLGMRGCTTTDLRRLGQIKDDDLRGSVIRAFIDSYTNTADVSGKKAAMEQLKRAIGCANSSMDVLALTNTDPSAGGPAITPPDNYTELMKRIRSMKVTIGKGFKEQTIEAFCNAAVNFSMNESTPEADSLLSNIKTEADELAKSLMHTIQDIQDMVRELQSLQGVKVTDDEGNAV